MSSSIELVTSYLKPSILVNLVFEPHNQDYQACTFSVGTTSYRSRLAKKTPKKKGYFVACWEKDTFNQNQAYSYEKYPDSLIVAIIDDSKKGLFIFPKEILLKKYILKTKNQSGKMAFRLYPIWETGLNPTAQKTQNWQVPYFTNLSKETTHL